jgi:hypothetical protein
MAFLLKSYFLFFVVLELNTLPRFHQIQTVFFEAVLL